MSSPAPVTRNQAIQPPASLSFRSQRLADAEETQTPQTGFFPAQANAADQVRDRNPALGAPAAGKDEHLVPTLPPQSSAVLTQIGPAPQAGYVAAPQAPVNAADAAPLSPEAFEPVPLVAVTVPPLAPVVAEPTFAPAAGVLSSMLPLDLSALESSVKAFFDKLDTLGFKLSATQVDLLFSSGIIAVAATIAAEITRRKVRAPVPALTPRRPGSIPYSDFM